MLELREQHGLRLSRDPITVTYLELAEPGGLRPSARPAPPGFAIRRVDDPGLNRDLYTRIGAAHEWVDRLPWSEAEWREWCARVETHVVEVEGEPVGLFELQVEKPGAGASGGGAEIAILGIVPSHQGRGLGGLALTAATRRAFELARPVRVNTNSIDGPHALRNYLARGFRAIGTRQRPRPGAAGRERPKP